jgi:hypothetical protein
LRVWPLPACTWLVTGGAGQDSTSWKDEAMLVLKKDRKKALEENYLEEARRASTICPAGRFEPHEKLDLGPIPTTSPLAHSLKFGRLNFFGKFGANGGNLPGFLPLSQLLTPYPSRSYILFTSMAWKRSSVRSRPGPPNDRRQDGRPRTLTKHDSAFPHDGCPSIFLNTTPGHLKRS